MDRLELSPQLRERIALVAEQQTDRVGVARVIEHELAADAGRGER